MCAVTLTQKIPYQIVNLTSFMKQMLCNALNIKTASKQVWLYFICKTMRLGFVGTITIFQIVSNTPKNTTQKNACQMFLPVLRSSRHLKSAPPQD